MRTILYLKLRFLAKLMLARYQPTVIGITGSIGKTSTKNAIYTVLNRAYPVRKSYKSYNNQIGVPLTILGFETAGNNIFGWLKILFLSVGRIVYQSDYPQILVLELGADRKGDLKYLTSFTKPSIGVLTGIGSSHQEHFKDQQEIIKEKKALIDALPEQGTAILNFDNQPTKNIGLQTDCQVVYYGLDQGAGFQATDIKFTEHGMEYKLAGQGQMMPVKMKALGKSQVYNSLAALAVASVFKLDLVEAVSALKNYDGEKGRQRMLPGKKQTQIIDDSYNSAPESAEMALETLSELPVKGRRIAILGDMLELGDISNRAHLDLGRNAAKTVSLLITVGELGKIVKQGAELAGLSNIKHYQTVEDLNKDILPIIQKDDMILIKASQGIRLDRAVKKILSMNLDPRKELVRQSNEWGE